MFLCDYYRSRISVLLSFSFFNEFGSGSTITKYMKHSSLVVPVSSLVRAGKWHVSSKLAMLRQDAMQ